MQISLKDHCDAADDQLRQPSKTQFQNDVDHPLNGSSVCVVKPKWAKTVTEVAEEEEEDNDRKAEAKKQELQHAIESSRDEI